jgi:drug/metabolite transporter (DMT)-like permease
MIGSVSSFFRIDSSRASKLIGGAAMLLWALSFSTLLSLVKTLSPDLNSILIVFLRYLFGIICFAPFLIKAGPTAFYTSRPLLHLIRVCCLAIATLCTYYAYRHLPLVLATSVGMTGPLFTTMLAMLLLGESVSLSKWGLIFLGYLGVLVMVRPFDMSFDAGIGVALLANLFSGLGIISVKVLSRTESTPTLLLYVNTFTTLIAGVLAISVWEIPSLHDFIILMIVGVLGLLSQYSLIIAMKHANPSYLAPFEYMRMCFAIPVGYLFFAEVPTFWVLVGSTIIIAATYGLTRLELTPRLSQKKDQTSSR